LFGLDLSTIEVRIPENVSGVFMVSVISQSNLGQISEQFISRTIELTSVADVPNIAAQNARGQLGTNIPLTIGTSLADIDGSENLTLSLRGIPAGMTIGDGQAILNSNSESTWYDITNLDLSNLYLGTEGGLSGNFSLEFKATATEATNADAADSTIRFEVLVDQVLPVLKSANQTEENPPVNSSILSEDPNSAKTSGESSNDPSAAFIADVDNTMNFSQTNLVLESTNVADQNSLIIALKEDIPFDRLGVNNARIVLSYFAAANHNFARSHQGLERSGALIENPAELEFGRENLAPIFSQSAGETEVASMNSVVLIMWNMIRFTITTLPTTREHEFANEIRVANHSARQQRS
jgi:hypothetical protein